MKRVESYPIDKVNLKALRQYLDIILNRPRDYMETCIEGEIFGFYRYGFFMAVPSIDRPDLFYLSYGNEDEKIANEIFQELEKRLLQKELNDLNSSKS